MQLSKMTNSKAYKVAVELYQKRMLRRAIAIVDQIVEQQPEHLHAQHLRGVILLELEDLARAEASLRRSSWFQDLVRAAYEALGDFAGGRECSWIEQVLEEDAVRRADQCGSRE